MHALVSREITISILLEWNDIHSSVVCTTQAGAPINKHKTK